MTPRIPYDTDISEQQWQLLKPHLPEAKTGGRKRTTNLREVINAVFYLLRAGCAWRLLPHDFPKWQTVYSYFRQWQEDGTWRHLNDWSFDKMNFYTTYGAYSKGLDIVDSVFFEIVKTPKKASHGHRP